MNRVLAEKTQVARKSHICAECSRTIPAGTVYSRAAISDGSSVWHWMAHTDCLKMANAIADEWDPVDLYDGRPPLSDMEDWREHAELTYWRGHYPHVVARLTFGLTW